MTLVNVLCRAEILNTIPGLTRPIKYALLKYLNYCELGSVSPDYPALVFWNSKDQAWANMMHYYKTSDFIRRCVPIVYAQDWKTCDAKCCIAWLFGYLAHLVTDLTIHPIVNERVGPYAQNKRRHRVCEMHQDVHIFNAKLLGEIDNAEYIRDCGIASCNDPNERKRFNPVIDQLWSSALCAIPLSDVHMKEGLSAPTAAPEPARWHSIFVNLIDKIAEEGGRVPPLARSIVEAAGWTYPSVEDIDSSYIIDLKTPDGGVINYDEVFQRTIENVKSMWSELGQALDQGKPELFTLANGDLDTGKAGERFLFWGQA